VTSSVPADLAIDAWVEQQLAAAPPLTEAQRRRLVELLRPSPTWRDGEARDDATGRCSKATCEGLGSLLLAYSENLPATA
jgi:hypothetical protein